jgi:hypothetical protein
VLRDAWAAMLAGQGVPSVEMAGRASALAAA